MDAYALTQGSPPGAVDLLRAVSALDAINHFLLALGRSEESVLILSNHGPVVGAAFPV